MLKKHANFKSTDYTIRQTAQGLKYGSTIPLNYELMLNFNLS